MVVDFGAVVICFAGSGDSPSVDEYGGVVSGLKGGARGTTSLVSESVLEEGGEEDMVHSDGKMSSHVLPRGEC